MPDKPNTAEPSKPRRGWFQFRLRTLLIVVALIGPVGYVGREAAIVQARRNWLAANLRSYIGSFAGRKMLIATKFDLMKSPGTLRLWLGDSPEYFIEVRQNTKPTQEELSGIINLFPEARITVEWQ